MSETHNQNLSSVMSHTEGAILFPAQCNTLVLWLQRTFWSKKGSVQLFVTARVLFGAMTNFMQGTFCYQDFDTGTDSVHNAMGCTDTQRGVHCCQNVTS